MTGWPHCCASFSPTMRGIRSALPPGGKRHDDAHRLGRPFLRRKLSTAAAANQGQDEHSHRAHYNEPMLSEPGPPKASTRVPYWVYQDAEIYRRGAGADLPRPDVELPVPRGRAARAEELRHHLRRRHAGGRRARRAAARCTHGRTAARTAARWCACRRAARAERFSCIYHNWTYDHAGNLTNVAFRNGIAGKGGMPADAKPEIAGAEEAARRVAQRPGVRHAFRRGCRRWKPISAPRSCRA